MNKDNRTGQRAARQPAPTTIIVERHYVGTEKMETVFKRIAEEQKSLFIKQEDNMKSSKLNNDKSESCGG